MVVCVPSSEDSTWNLPGARLGTDRDFISGGERSLYELATAAVVAGYSVELRGDVNAAILATVTAAAGAGPALPPEARRPRAGEIVVMPEAYDLARLAAIHLSGACSVMYALAPPGLFGWSFRSEWTLPDHVTVPVEEVGHMETFQAIAALGISVWTNAHGIAAAAQAAGVPVVWLGTGTPVPFPAAGPKVFDLAVVEANRWRVSTEQLLPGLAEFSVLRVPARPSVYSICPELAGARVLLWPSRVEGMSRISREARAVGTVPVALDTNPFATRDDHGDGIVLVPDLASLEREARRLLEHPAELAHLADRAVVSVREQADWDAFVGGVGAAIVGLEGRPDAPARAALGALLTARLRHLETSVAVLSTAERALIERLAVAEADLADRTRDLARSRSALASSDADGTAAELRFRDALAALDESQAEVSAFRSRRMVRILDQIAVRLRPKRAR